MGREWDKDKGGRDAWIEWMAGVAAEALRVCKPGAHAFVWALPRTSHWTAMAWENAGWVPRDRVAHVFATGFPKSLDVSKAIDRRQDWTLVERLAAEIARAREEAGLSLRDIGVTMMEHTAGQYGKWYHRGGHMFFETGRSLPSRPEWAQLREVLPIGDEFLAVYEEAEREVVGQTIHARSGGNDFAKIPGAKATPREADITAPATDAAKKWEGFGTALKPAMEDWWLFRKGLVGTVAENVLRHGTGAINIDATRVGAPLPPTSPAHEVPADASGAVHLSCRGWPFYTDGPSPECVRDALQRIASALRSCSTDSTSPSRGGGGQDGTSPADDGCDALRGHLYPNGVWCGLPLMSTLDYQGDCPSCRRSCGGLARLVEGADLASARSLADALVDMCSALSAPAHSHGCQCTCHPSSSGVLDHISSFVNLLCSCGDTNTITTVQRPVKGRWPPNLLFSHHASCEQVGVKRVRGSGWRDSDKQKSDSMFLGEMEYTGTHYTSPDGTETVPDMACHPDCAVRALGEMSGESGDNWRRNKGLEHSGRHGGIAVHGPNLAAGTDGARGVHDTGTAARFYPCFKYQSKASTFERSLGMTPTGGGDRVARNSHPT